MATTINQFTVGNLYNSSQLKDLEADSGYNLHFQRAKKVGISVATVKKARKLIASFLLTRRGRTVDAYKRIY